MDCSNSFTWRKLVLEGLPIPRLIAPNIFTSRDFVLALRGTVGELITRELNIGICGFINGMLIIGYQVPTTFKEYFFTTSSRICSLSSVIFNRKFPKAQTFATPPIFSVGEDVPVNSPLEILNYFKVQQCDHISSIADSLEGITVNKISNQEAFAFCDRAARLSDFDNFYVYGCLSFVKNFEYGNKLRLTETFSQDLSQLLLTHINKSLGPG